LCPRMPRGWRRRRPSGPVRACGVREAVGRYLGKPWSRQADHQAERGGRAFTATELTAIALAHDTSIPALFLADEECVDLPGREISSEEYRGALLHADKDTPWTASRNSSWPCTTSARCCPGRHWSAWRRSGGWQSRSPLHGNATCHNGAAVLQGLHMPVRGLPLRGSRRVWRCITSSLIRPRSPCPSPARGRRSPLPARLGGQGAATGSPSVCHSRTAMTTIASDSASSKEPRTRPPRAPKTATCRSPACCSMCRISGSR